MREELVSEALDTVDNAPVVVYADAAAAVVVVGDDESVNTA